jgi:hypothetical protein
VGPVNVPLLDAEKELDFECDMEIRMSELARAALTFMRTAAERYGDEGQPLWPVVPSSLHGAFLAGEAKDARILAITFDASVDGWGAVVRSAPEKRGTVVARKLSSAIAWPLPCLGGRSWTRWRFLHAQPRRCIRRRWLAFSPHGPPASCYSLADSTVLLCSDCTGAISAPRKGSLLSPALQNVALLHNRLFMNSYEGGGRGRPVPGGQPIHPCFRVHTGPA